ncbi:hypothetical protein E2C01_071173 [Portunus trituberculatus]|uniref:Uncharacterized protein n=1 Tax=Portunus trituberculatus TaxID=210409 RepID=A0A5B7I3Q1_PORTR|nr:hypothetical protein [Portunus trituberculatus]
MALNEGHGRKGSQGCSVRGRAWRARHLISCRSIKGQVTLPGWRTVFDSISGGLRVGLNYLRVGSILGDNEAKLGRLGGSLHLGLARVGLGEWRLSIC